MQKNKDYRICTDCEIHHFENCESCFGFGVYEISTKQNEAFPVTAEEARDKQFIKVVLPCPECGSTELGLPNPVLQLTGGQPPQNMNVPTARN